MVRYAWYVMLYYVYGGNWKNVLWANEELLYICVLEMRRYVCMSRYVMSMVETEKNIIWANEDLLYLCTRKEKVCLYVLVCYKYVGNWKKLL